VGRRPFYRPPTFSHCFLLTDHLSGTTSRWVGNVVRLLEEAVLRVDEPNIAELHVTRAVHGEPESQRGELLDVQTLVGMRHTGTKVKADSGPAKGELAFVHVHVA
jgi:hypothetical protein